MSQLVEEPRLSMALAIRSGHVGAVQRLLADGASANVCDERKWPAIVLAAQLRQIECARALLDAGADPSASISMQAQNFRGYTALMMGSCAEVARMLLEAGADPNAVSEHQTAALDVAVAAQDAQFVSLLLVHGAEVPDHLRDPQYWAGFGSEYEPVRRVIFAHLTARNVDAAMPIEKSAAPQASRSLGASPL